MVIVPLNNINLCDFGQRQVLPIFGFTSAAMIWQWVMSVDAHWYSTLFAWYSTASAFVSMIALTILLIIFLKNKGYFTVVNDNHIHDLGKFLFAISIFWTYLWFSTVYADLVCKHRGRASFTLEKDMIIIHIYFFGNLIINFFSTFFYINEK